MKGKKKELNLQDFIQTPVPFRSSQTDLPIFSSALWRPISQCCRSSGWASGENSRGAMASGRWECKVWNRNVLPDMFPREPDQIRRFRNRNNCGMVGFFRTRFDWMFPQPLFAQGSEGATSGNHVHMVSPKPEKSLWGLTLWCRAWVLPARTRNLAPCHVEPWCSAMAALPSPGP